MKLYELTYKFELGLKLGITKQQLKELFRDEIEEFHERLTLRRAQIMEEQDEIKRLYFGNIK